MTAPDSIDAYVRSALALQGYRLDEEQTQRVIEQFIRIEAVAQGFLGMPLALHDEPAPVFQP
jgi:hypothetical protein